MHVNSPRDPFSNCRVSFAEKHLFRSASSEQKFTWKSLIEQRIFAVRGSVEHFSSTSSINNCGSTVIVWNHSKCEFSIYLCAQAFDGAAFASWVAWESFCSFLKGQHIVEGDLCFKVLSEDVDFTLLDWWEKFSMTKTWNSVFGPNVSSAEDDFFFWCFAGCLQDALQVNFHKMTLRAIV